MISGFARGRQKTKGILWGIFGRSSDGEINLPDLRRKAGYNLPRLFMDHESYLENGRDLSSRFKFPENDNSDTEIPNRSLSKKEAVSEIILEFGQIYERVISPK